jgi:hypothetical protein
MILLVPPGLDDDLAGSWSVEDDQTSSTWPGGWLGWFCLVWWMVWLVLPGLEDRMTGSFWPGEWLD